MAAENELQLWADREEQARPIAEAAIADALRIEAKYSRYLDDSITTRINRGAGGRNVEIDPETSALLRYADTCHRLSGGVFDITSGVLRRVWDFRRTTPRLPAMRSRRRGRHRSPRGARPSRAGHGAGRSGVSRSAATELAETG